MEATVAPVEREWMTLTEAAKYMRCGIHVIYDLISHKAIQAYVPAYERLNPETHKANSTRRLVNKADLDAYIRAMPATPSIAR